MLTEMNRAARADDVLKQIRELPTEERAYVEAELAKDAEAQGGNLSPAFVAMITERVQHAIDHPESTISGDQFFAWLEKLRDDNRRK